MRVDPSQGGFVSNTHAGAQFNSLQQSFAGNIPAQSFVGDPQGNIPASQQSFVGHTPQSFMGGPRGNTPASQQSFAGNTAATPAQSFMGGPWGNTPAL